MLRDAATDLLLGGSCVGCDRPGRVLCPTCERWLPTDAVPAWPSPPPPGLASPWAVAAYDGVLRAMVLGHKERGQLGLGRPLAGLLATAVAAGVPAGPLLLVPVPSRRSAVRARGHDPTAAITRGAARVLRRRGRAVAVAGLLRLRAGVADQAGLDAEQRSANLAGSMACSAGALRRLARRCPGAHVVVCDDVLTTGVTAREAQRALEAVGLAVRAVAVVAATQRRVPGAGGAARNMG